MQNKIFKIKLREPIAYEQEASQNKLVCKSKCANIRQKTQIYKIGWQQDKNTIFER